jgi:hypothetical protein
MTRTAATERRTVGFGDVTPVGQWARALVTLHLVFDVAFIALVANLLKRSVEARSGPSS